MASVALNERNIEFKLLNFSSKFTDRICINKACVCCIFAARPGVMSSDSLPLKSVSYGPPRGSLTNRNIMNGLRANLVPAVAGTCQIVAIRCVFGLSDLPTATKQLAARRRQLEIGVLQNPEVSSIL